MQTIMTNPGDFPTLPAELAELVLLHLPAAVVVAERGNRQAFGITQCWSWAHCILPSGCGLPLSSIRHAAIKYTNAERFETWHPLFAKLGRTNKPRTAASLIKICTLWFKLTNDKSHTYAAFDCAATHNRVDVLDAWMKKPESVLPQRTGVDPQPEIILGDAFDSERQSFKALIWLHKHMLDGVRSDCSLDACAISLAQDGDAKTLKKLIKQCGGRDEFCELVGDDTLFAMEDVGREFGPYNPALDLI